MRCFLSAACLLGAGCAAPYPDELVISAEFSIEDQAAIVSAVDTWTAHCGNRMPPARIGDPIEANIRRDCEGWPGQMFFTSQTIDLCPEAKTELRRIALHEFAHLLRQDELHTEEPDSILQIRGFLPETPSAADVALVCP